MRFLSASSVDHCPVSFDHRNRRQAQAVTRISVSDPQQILCSSSGTGDLIGGSSIASPTLGAPGLVSSYAFNFYPEAAGRKCLRLFQLGGGRNRDGLRSGPARIALMRIIALLFSFMLTGCAGTRLDAETTPTAVAPSAPPMAATFAANV